MSYSILVVEDEPDIRDGIVIDLEQSGQFDCLAVGTEAEVFRLLKARFDPFNAILVDISFPGNMYAGIGLIQNFKANPKFKSCPILVLSARSQAGTILEALSHGAIDYLVKPYRPHELIQRVRRACQLGAQGTAFRLDAAPPFPEDEASDVGKPVAESILDWHGFPDSDYLVFQLNTALQYWELSTNKSRAEFVVDSGIWGYYLTESGSPRSKTLTRYLSVESLPNKPKLNLIIKTIDYVLANTDSVSPTRETLVDASQRLKAFLFSNPH